MLQCCLWVRVAGERFGVQCLSTHVWFVNFSFYHDHIFVQAERATDALRVLKELSYRYHQSTTGSDDLPDSQAS